MDLDLDTTINPDQSPVQESITSTNDNLETDISSWFNDGRPIKIFSDYEGTTTTQQLENVKNIFKSSGDYEVKCMYLGDLFDNANFADKKIEEGKSTCIETKNYCALQMLQLFVNNPNKCKYVVGNRDINKIKLYPLLQFSDGSKWWDDGNTYEDIVVNLLNKVYPGNSSTPPIKWLVESMDTYEPFWNKVYPNCGKTNWKDINYLKIGNLFDRYNKIFGQDCVAGTMSADYTIRGMPNELFGDDVEKFIADIRNRTERLKDRDLYNINNKTNSKQVSTPTQIRSMDIKKEKEIRAAIVFTLFMRMLDKDLIPKEGIKGTRTSGITGSLDGYLYKYLSTAYPSFYAENTSKTNLYLFAHGGITQAFCRSGNNNAFALLEKVDWSQLPINTTLIQKKTPFETLSTFAKSSSLIDKMTEFNKIYQHYFNSVFTFFSNFMNYKTQKPELKYTNSEELLILLSLSAPAENNTYIKSFGYTSDLSPIQPKLPIDQQLKEYSSKTGTVSTYINIYNFCGHASAGIGGYAFKKLQDSTIYVNTDYSSSLFKKDLNCTDKTKYNNNNLMLTLEKKGDIYDLILKGQIDIPAKLNSKYNISTLNPDSPGTESLKTLLKPANQGQSPKYITIVYDDYKFDVTDSEVPEAYNQPTEPLTETYKNAFNGVGKINGFKYKIYSQWTNGNTFFLEEYKEPTTTTTTNTTGATNNATTTITTNTGTGTTGNNTNALSELMEDLGTDADAAVVGGYKKNYKKSRKTSKHNSRKNKNRNSKYKLYHSKKTQKYKNKNRNRNRNRNTKKNKTIKTN